MSKRFSRIFSDLLYLFPSTTNLAATPSSCPDHMVSTFLHFFFSLLLIMCLHDENFHLIRSFHSSSDEPFSGTDEGYYFLGCLIKHIVFLFLYHVLFYLCDFTH